MNPDARRHCAADHAAARSAPAIGLVSAMDVAPPLEYWAARLFSVSVGRAQLVMVLCGLIVIAGGWFAASTAQAKIRSEEALIYSGTEIRDAIASYWFAAPAGKRELPRGLSDLLDDRRGGEHRRHLARPIPDPVSGSDDWVIEWTSDHRMSGVHSASEGAPVGRYDFDPEAIRVDGNRHYSQWVFRFDPGRFAPPQTTVARGEGRPATNSGAPPVDSDLPRLRGSTQLSTPSRTHAEQPLASRLPGATAYVDPRGVVHVPALTANEMRAETGRSPGLSPVPSDAHGSAVDSRNREAPRSGHGGASTSPPAVDEGLPGRLPSIGAFDGRPDLARKPSEPAPSRTPAWMVPPRLEALGAGWDRPIDSGPRPASPGSAGGEPRVLANELPPSSGTNRAAAPTNTADAESSVGTRLRRSLDLALSSTTPHPDDVPSVVTASASEPPAGPAGVDRGQQRHRIAAAESAAGPFEWCDTLDATWRHTCDSLERTADPATADRCRSRAAARVAGCRAAPIRAATTGPVERSKSPAREQISLPVPATGSEGSAQSLAAEPSGAGATDAAAGEGLILTNADLPAPVAPSSIDAGAASYPHETAPTEDRSPGRGRKRGPSSERASAIAHTSGSLGGATDEEADAPLAHHVLSAPGGDVPPPRGAASRGDSLRDRATGVAAGVMPPPGSMSDQSAKDDRALPYPNESTDSPSAAFIELPASPDDAEVVGNGSNDRARRE